MPHNGNQHNFHHYTHDIIVGPTLVLHRILLEVLLLPTLQAVLFLSQNGVQSSIQLWQTDFDIRRIKYLHAGVWMSITGCEFWLNFPLFSTQTIFKANDRQFIFIYSLTILLLITLSVKK